VLPQLDLLLQPQAIRPNLRLRWYLDGAMGSKVESRIFEVSTGWWSRACRLRRGVLRVRNRGRSTRTLGHLLVDHANQDRKKEFINQLINQLKLMWMAGDE
jgi:hypothetical protein